MKARKTAAVLLSAVMLAGCKGAEPANTVQTTEFVTTAEEITTAGTTTTTTTTTTATDPVPEAVDTTEDGDDTDISAETTADTTAEAFSGETPEDTVAAVMTEAPVTTTDTAAAVSTAATTTAPVTITTTAAPAATTTTTPAPAATTTAATTTAPKTTTASKTTTTAPVTTTAGTTTTTAAPETEAPDLEQAAPVISADGWRSAYSGALEDLIDEAGGALDDASVAASSGEYADGIREFRRAASLLDGLNGSYYTTDPGVPPELSGKHAALVSVARELKAAAEDAAGAMDLLISSAVSLEVYFGYDSPVEDVVGKISDAAYEVDTEDEFYEEAVSNYTETVDDIVSGLGDIDTSLPDSTSEVQSVLGEWQTAANRLRSCTPPSGFESLHSALCGHLDKVVKYLTDFRDAVSRYYSGYANKAEGLLERLEEAYDEIDSEVR